MNNKEMKTLIKTARKFAKPFRVTDDDFRLKDLDPSDTLEFTSEDKPRAKETLTMGIEVLAELQNMLYAQDSWSVLLIFQAMDAAGKDGVIKHVMSGVNPQGCQVFSFKAPTSEDLDHDYMWRCMKCLPERGRKGERCKLKELAAAKKALLGNNDRHRENFWPRGTARPGQ